MEQVRQSDLRQALDLIGECEDAADPTSFGNAVLGVGRLVPGAVAFNEIDLANRTATAIKDRPGLGGAASVAEFARLAHQNPLIVHGRFGDPPMTISDTLSARSFRALELYEVIFAPNDFEDQIAIHLGPVTSRVAGIAINRERRGYSARDRALLELLAPHLSRAYAHSLGRARAAAVQAMLERGLGDAGTGAVVITPDGSIDRIEEHADAILRRYFGATAEGDLPTPVRDWLALEEGARGSFEAEDGKGRRLSMRLVTHGDDGAPWRALLLDEWGLDPAPGELRAFGLTPREAEILAWVARGKSDVAIGNLLSISPRTTNKHLEHIYRKLHVNSRAEAVAKANSRLVG
jgi:DNA-binding CsgD family transcriptional regulator